MTHQTAINILSIVGFIESLLALAQSLQAMYWMKQYQDEHAKVERYRGLVGDIVWRSERISTDGAAEAIDP